MRIDFGKRSICCSVIYAGPQPMAVGTAIGLLAACPQARLCLPEPTCILLPNIAHIPDDTGGSRLMPFSLYWSIWNPDYPSCMLQVVKESDGHPDLIVLGGDTGGIPRADPRPWVASHWPHLAVPVLHHSDRIPAREGGVFSDIDAGEGLDGLVLAAARLVDGRVRQGLPPTEYPPVALVPGAMIAPTALSLLARTRELLLHISSLDARRDRALRREVESLRRQLLSAAAYSQAVDGRAARSAKAMQSLIEHIEVLSRRAGVPMPEIAIPLDDTVPADSSPTVAAETWCCPTCETANPTEESSCQVCGTVRPASSPGDR